MKFDGIALTSSKTYIDLMKRCADDAWKQFKEQDYMDFTNEIKTNVKEFNSTTTLVNVFGKVQYGYPLQSCAEVYKHTKDKTYATIGMTYIKRIIEIYEWIKSNTTISDYDFETMTLIETAFAGGPFSKGCLIFRELGVMDDDTYHRLQPVWEASVRFAMRLPEWGPFNRCTLRMITFDRVSRLYPNSKIAQEAGKMAKFLAEDSIGRWSIEDTIFYNGIWYISVLEYLLENNIQNFRTETIFRYYATYLTHLQLPEGSMPDYGDSRPREFGCVALGTGFIEWAASHFNDGEIRYCACKLMDWANTYFEGNITSGWLSRTYAVAADALIKNEVAPVKPNYISGEVIDDLVGKKIVFRGENDDYMLLNYRDEGDYALPARMNMYSTIPAPAEKVHHGHADENSIVVWAYKGKHLICDGGYRDKIVTDGHYRADFYHNRVVIRNGRMFKEKGFLEYAENLGTYLKVNTQKVFYYESGNIEVSRTRLDDTAHHSAVNDRTVIHFVKENMYAVIDTVKATKTYEYTTGQMWFGDEIKKCGKADYLIKQNLKDLMGPAGTENLGLRVGFVRKDLPISIEKLRRLGDDNQKALSQYYTEYLGEGEYLHFVTLLMPEDGDDDKKRNTAIIASADCEQVADGKALRFTVKLGGTKYTFGMKMDETYGFMDYKHRPTYSYEAGKATYGDFETDALFAVFAEVKDKIDYVAWMFSRLDYKGKTCYASLKTQFANNDLSNHWGAMNHVRWEDTISKKK